jgi:hypothetical protein
LLGQEHVVVAILVGTLVWVMPRLVCKPLFEFRCMWWCIFFVILLSNYYRWRDFIWWVNLQMLSKFSLALETEVRLWCANGAVVFKLVLIWKV